MSKSGILFIPFCHIPISPAVGCTAHWAVVVGSELPIVWPTWPAALWCAARFPGSLCGWLWPSRLDRKPAGSGFRDPSGRFYLCRLWKQLGTWKTVAKGFAAVCFGAQTWREIGLDHLTWKGLRPLYSAMCGWIWMKFSMANFIPNSSVSQKTPPAGERFLIAFPFKRARTPFPVIRRRNWLLLSQW